MPCRLRVLIPAVENSISGEAFRPGDILDSRKGLTVEINNTDAEGRLVLADALALADEDRPDLIVSMATLTGAARVAVGPDLAPFYATDDSDAAALEAAAKAVRDPGLETSFLGTLREDDRAGNRGSGQCAEGRFRGIDHGRTVPSTIRHGCAALHAFRHLRLDSGFGAGPSQGRGRAGDSCTLRGAAGDAWMSDRRFLAANGRVARSELKGIVEVDLFTDGKVFSLAGSAWLLDSPWGQADRQLIFGDRFVELEREGIWRLRVFVQGWICRLCRGGLPGQDLTSDAQDHGSLHVRAGGSECKGLARAGLAPELRGSRNRAIRRMVPNRLEESLVHSCSAPGRT